MPKSLIHSKENTVNKLFLIIPFVSISLCGCAIFDSKDGPADTVKKDTFEVFFDFDKSTISDTAAKIILDAATSAKNEKITSITLSVHTDPSLRNSAGHSLAERRLNAISAELTKDGIPSGQIILSEVDTDMPIVPTEDGLHEPQNRRMEIILR